MARPPQPTAIHVAFVQDGARLHYALPLALHQAGALDRMFTDWFVRPGSCEQRLAKLLTAWYPAAGRAADGRRCPELDQARVLTNPWLRLRIRLARRRFARLAQFHRWEAGITARWIEHQGFGDANLLMGFVRNLDPSLLAFARRQGLRIVADQIIAPAAVEIAEARNQRERFPHWAGATTDDDLRDYDDWERQSWKHLDHITCASDYVYQGLLQQGIAPDRISVLPYPIASSAVRAVDRSARQQAITVGFVGSVGLRKGAPYFIQVAKRLAGATLRFVMVGPVEAPDAASRDAGDRVELVGRVDRSAVADWLARFDLLLFPSTCEGSAGAVMEAMASGLPVVCSPNAGAPIRDGVEGFVRAYDDVDGMTDCVERLAAAPDLRRTMGLAARTRAQQFSVNAYRDRLTDLLRRVHTTVGLS